MEQTWVSTPGNVPLCFPAPCHLGVIAVEAKKSKQNRNIIVSNGKLPESSQAFAACTGKLEASAEPLRVGPHWRTSPSFSWGFTGCSARVVSAWWLLEPAVFVAAQGDAQEPLPWGSQGKGILHLWTPTMFHWATALCAPDPPPRVAWVGREAREKNRNQLVLL